jgi:cystathionine beta-synthase
MKRYKSILEAIGNTPLIHLNRISKELGLHVYAKWEGLNPGLSAKDRIAVYIIEQAENKGLLSPDSTLVEATSGNTGFSLAMVAAVKGYRCICTTTDKSSTEKIAQLKLLGAEVEICPANVPADNPQSYYSRARDIAASIEGGVYINQYFNKLNRDAHYHTTGPEIWDQMDGEITHLIAPASTGGTISGTGQFLKEKNPAIRLIAADAYGSVLKKYHETGELDPEEAYSYLIEGLGKKIIPGNINFDLIDQFVKVTDKDSALKARHLAAKEGILAGYTSGAVLSVLYQLADSFENSDQIVLLLSDHGTKYLSKIYNDNWMIEQGFLPTAKVNGSQVKKGVQLPL